MCKDFEVSRSNYYDWLNRTVSSSLELETEIKEIFVKSRETYSY